MGPQGGVRHLLRRQASPTVRLLSNSCWSVVKPGDKPVVRLISSSCCRWEKLYSKKHEWVEVVQGQGEVREYGWNTDSFNTKTVLVVMNNMYGILVYALPSYRE